MADTTTTNYGLTKPEVGASEDTWGTKINTNLDTLDTTVDSIQGKSGAGVLKHTNNTKLATTSTGIDVTGNLTMASGGSIVAGGANDLILNAGESGTPDIYLQSGSSTKVKIEGSNGNVGIGTSSPAAKLDISGVFQFFDDTTPELRIVDSDDNNYALIGYTDGTMSLSSNHGNEAGGADVMQFLTGGAERMRIDASGRVGIGRAPSLTNSKLEVGGADNVSLINVEASGVTGGMGIGSTGLQFFHGSSAKMRIDSSGNLLVGKTAADGGVNGGEMRANGETYLTATSAQPLALNRKSTDGALLNFSKDGTTVGSIGTNGGRLSIGSGDVNLNFNASANSIYPISDTAGTLSDAIVDVGASTARFKDLYLSGTAKSQAVELEDIKAKDTNGLNLQTSNGQKRVILDNSGNLLLGTTSVISLGKQCIEFDGYSANGLILKTTNTLMGSAYLGFVNSSGAVIGSINQLSTSTVAYNTSSDQRLKENIADADDAGSKIDAIQVRQYDWKADGSHQDYGMIAQELQAVAPEAVSGDADSEDMMGVDYSKLVPMLVKEIQSLRNRVAQLEE